MRSRLAATGLRVCVLALIRDATLAGLSSEVSAFVTLSDALCAKDATEVHFERCVVCGESREVTYVLSGCEPAGEVEK